MLNWFKKRVAPEPQGINPPWQKGQYVTYFLDRGDGTWAAFALKLLGQFEDSSWIMTGDFKTGSGECTVWFRSDPAAQEGTLDIAPVKEEVVRKSPGAESSDVKSDPMVLATLALNLLWVSRWKSAHELMESEPRPASYPCGVDRIHELVTDGPGYKKHHALNRRVMLTGVACLSIDGGQSPMTATSFGTSDPDFQRSESFDDWVDLSHPKKVEHEGFSLTYPATWFLRQEPVEKAEPEEPQQYSAAPGGVSTAVAIFVTVHRGKADHLAHERESISERMGNPVDLAGRYLPRRGESLALPGGALGFVTDRVPDGVHGVIYCGVFTSPSGDRLAQVLLTGTVATLNPRRAAILAEMEPAFRGIIESFSFT